MSLTKMRPVPGSSTSRIIRAGAPSMSGNEANSVKSTRITPLVDAIGDGKGSLDVCENDGDAVSNAAAITKVTRKVM